MPELLDTPQNHQGSHPESRMGEAWAVAKFSSVGIEIGIAIFIGWWVGQWLDKRYGTDPWLMLLCFTIGVCAAFKGLMRSAKEAAKKLDEDEELD